MKIENEELIKALVEYQAECKELGGRPQMSDYLGIAFYNIAEQAAFKSNYSHPAYADDMKLNAVEECVKKIGSFDSDKSSNPHAYFMKICMGSFHDTAANNTKQNAIIGGVMDELGVSTPSSQEFMVNYYERNPPTVYKSLTNAARAGKSYNWIHKDGRKFAGIIMELVVEYPKERLDKSSLSKVIKGARSHYKGWSVIK